MNLAYVLGIVVLIIGIGLSVALHELGHMIPAKCFGVKVPEYFIGFGPRLWSFRRGETEYGIKAIWLGGYVKLVGMLPPENPARPDRRRKDGSPGMVAESRAEALEEITPGEEDRAFYRLSVPRKLTVMTGGILTNLVLGILLLAVSLGVMGQMGYTTTVSTVAQCLPANVETTDQCLASDPTSPALAAGIQVGDTIRSWNGTPVRTWKDVQAQIAASGTAPTTVVVERDGKEIPLQVTATQVERTVYDASGRAVTDADGAPVTRLRPYVGISPTAGRVRVAPSELPGVLAGAVTSTVKAIVTLPSGLYHAVSAGLGHEQRSTNGVVGVVGMGRIAGEVSSAGPATVPLSVRISSMLGLLGSLNLALFAFNLIPLLPLDGGHVAGALWEGARRRWALAHGRPDPGPVDTARLLPIGQVVFGLLIVMAVVLVWVDIVAPV